MKKIFLMYLFIYMQTFSYINIYPLNFDKRIDGIGEVQEYVLTNITSENRKYRVDIEKVGEKDMSEWIEVYPKTLTLSPGEEGVIKVYINSSSLAQEGEYSSILNIRELAVPNLKKKEEQIEVYTNLKMRIYGYVGELNPKVEVDDLKVNLEEKLKLTGKLKNTSGRRIDIEILLGNDKKKYLVAEKRLKKDEIIELDKIDILSNLFEIKDIKKEKKLHLYIVEKTKQEIIKELKI